MKFTWNSILASDEKIQKEFGVSNAYVISILILTIIVSVIVAYQYIPAGLFLFVLGAFYSFYIKKAKHFAFTNKKIYLVESFIGTSIATIDFAQITDIEIDQSFIDSMGGWGTLIVNSAGTHAPLMSISPVDNPQALRQTLDKIKSIN